MTTHSLVLALAVGVAWVMGSLQGWNWAQRSLESRREGKPTGAEAVAEAVRVGEPLWWVHFVALAWAVAGVTLLGVDRYRESGLAFLACLTTSLPTIMHRHRIRIEARRRVETPTGSS